jgi:hypothetical protein
VTRPDYIRGAPPSLDPEAVKVIRERVARRRRALAIARRHSDKAIAREVGTSPRNVRHIASSPEAYKWVR